MLIDMTIHDFKFWSGAIDTVECLTIEELDEIEEILSEVYPHGLTQTEVNDFFWFERDTIADWLGYESFDEIMERD